MIIAGVVAVALQDHLPLTAMAALTALSSFLSGSLYGVFYETWVKQSYTLMVHELYADATTVPCAFELRDDACWGKTGHIEVAFPWSQGVSLNDKGDCIEVWCHPTLAVIRNRAFRSDSERQVFVETARRKSSR